MIDISTQAPLATASEGAAAMGSLQTGTGTPQSAGAAGFLHLFEILLGGMPQGGQIGSVAGQSVATGDATIAPLATGTVETPSLAGLFGQASAALQAAEGADSDSILSEGVLGTQDSEAIASLLQSLGFSATPSDIASLGPLDQKQLASALEFIQRGVQAGMQTNVILENAACLMPREWNYEGVDAAAAPRTGSLAMGEETEVAADPAQILASIEAIRQILSPASTTGGDAASIGESDASAKIGSTSGFQNEASPTGKPGNDSLHALEARKGITIRNETGSDSSSASASAETATPIAGSKRKVADASIGISEKASGGGASAEPLATKASSIDSLANSGLGVKVSAESVVAAPSITQGVKAGSMASEFIGRQVLEKVDIQLKQGRKELNVRLWPEELGEVRLSLRVGEADKLDARILVQTESVRQAILDATPQLRDALSRHGMEMGRLSVNIGSDMSGSGDAPGGQRRQSPEEGAGRFQSGAGWQDEEIEYGAALALGVDSGYRDGRNTLDMWS